MSPQGPVPKFYAVVHLAIRQYSTYLQIILDGHFKSTFSLSILSAAPTRCAWAGSF